MVTVVVPTRDRPEALRRCLAALAAQTCDELETVVVDDGSVDGAAVVRVAAEAGARLVRLDGRGAAAARNAGVAAARGEVVCFTDDDCEPEPAWAERLAARTGDVAAAVAGRTVAADPHDALAAAHEAIAAHLREEARTVDGTTAFAPSNNVACSRGLALAVPFDERYLRPGGEDRDWCARLVARGHRLAFEPGAVVRHRPSLTPAGFLRKEAAYAAASSRFRRTSGAPAAERPGFYVRLLRRGFAQGAWVGLLVLSAQVAAAVGVASDRVSGPARAPRSASVPPPRVS